jgi:putative membrane protein
MGYMIVFSDSPGWTFTLFCFTGMLGFFTLHYTFLSWHSLAGNSAILMPLLTGLFGISVLLTASQGTMPEQHYEGIRMEDRTIVKYSAMGTIAGVAVGWLPGLSTASANSVLASLIGYQTNSRTYILATSAANTSNAFIGLAALFALSGMRNGVMVALAELPLPTMSELTMVGVLAACSAYVITVMLSGSAGRLNGIDIRFMNHAVIAFCVILCFILTGPFGIIILILATALGLIPQLVNVPRVFCMGAIIVPVIFYSFGFTWI